MEKNIAVVPLSPRQTQILQRVAEGCASKQMAADLNISIKMVEKHRYDIRQRLGIRSIAELTRYAVNQGLVKV